MLLKPFGKNKYRFFTNIWLHMSSSPSSFSWGDGRRKTSKILSTINTIGFGQLPQIPEQFMLLDKQILSFL